METLLADRVDAFATAKWPEPSLDVALSARWGRPEVDELVSNTSSWKSRFVDGIAVVVCGHGLLDVQGRVKSSLQVRCRRAADLFVRLCAGGHRVCVIAVGGRVRNGRGRVSEAGVLAENLIALGVPAGAIMVEADAQNSYEEAIVAVARMQTFGINRMVIVVSEIQRKRVHKVFKQVCLHSGGQPHPGSRRAEEEWHIEITDDGYVDLDPKERARAIQRENYLHTNVDRHLQKYLD